MPRTVTLAHGLETTALGFGCADLFREPTSSKRLRLLEVAYDLGIGHFDVAPMYGLGAAERDVGQFARGRRDRIAIATKFGLAPTPIARQLARVQAPIRRLFNAIPALHKQARLSAAGPGSGSAGALLYANRGYNAASAKASLETSLRELGTEYIDLLLLHDPVPGDVLSEDVCAYLEHARGAGHIRTWGIAGEPAVTLQVAGSLPLHAPVLQLRDDIFQRSLRSLPRGTAAARITFGILGRALPRLCAYVTAEPERRQRWSAAVGVDCGDSEALAALLLRDALRENSSGTVLFSTIHPERMRSAAIAADGAPERPDAARDALRTLVSAELRNGTVTTEDLR